MIKTVAVIGNCQVEGISRCLEAMLPGAQVVPYFLTQLIKDEPAGFRDTALDWITQCDLVLSLHRHLGPPIEALQTARLKERCKLVIEYPVVAFNGFHPDCVYIRKNNAEMRGAMGPYHSALVAACFLEGIPQQRVPALFNLYTYSALNYRAAFDLAGDHLQGLATRLNFDFSRFLDKSEPRVFMHTVNHPRIDVLHHVACECLRLAGIAHETIDPSGIEDWLGKSAIWPVYPGMLEHIPATGPMVFQLAPGRTMSLPDFVARSYGYYEASAPLDTDPTFADARAFLKENVLAAA